MPDPCAIQPMEWAKAFGAAMASGGWAVPFLVFWWITCKWPPWRKRAQDAAGVLVLALALSWADHAMAGPCVPDTVAWTPTPVLSWDPVEGAHGFRVYTRAPEDPTWTLVETVSCQDVWEDTGEFIARVCPGVDLPYPVQRHGCETPRTETLWAVKAWNGAGDSFLVSNEVAICCPDLMTW